MTEKTRTRKVPQPPLCPDRTCPNCGGRNPRRTHETRILAGTHYTLCRCPKCWIVYWAANVGYLEIEPADDQE